LCCLLLPGVAWAEEAGDGPADEQEIQSLIQDLGSRSYRARERATEKLRLLGAVAIPELEKAAEFDDPEIRMRAAEVLRDLRLGITDRWPSDAVLMVRHYERVAEAERPGALKRLCEAVKEEAVPFLLARMAEGSEAEADCALEQLKTFKADAAWRRVIALVKEPKNAHQAKALAWALSQDGRMLDALKVLSEAEVEEKGARSELVENGVRGLLNRLDRRDYAYVAEHAPSFARLSPQDLRFIYLEAEALVALDRDGDAQALQAWARSFNPQDEAPHYLAAVMLEKLGRRRFAAAEWNAILRIPPKGSVYDVNAYLHLSSIYAACGHCARAADHLEKALALYKKARKAGEGMAIIGGTEEKLEQQIKELRRRAQLSPVPPGAPITDEIGEGGIQVNISVTVKGGRLVDLRRALGMVDAILSMEVKPRGLKLLDKDVLKFRVDREKHQLGMFLNESACSDPVPFKLEKEQAIVAVKTLDCCYIFEVDAASGKVEQIKRYEKDYVLRFRPGIKVAACTDVEVTINEEVYEWGKVLKGIEFDYLPQKLHITLEGTAPSGRRIKTAIDMDLKEPEITPAKPPRTE